MLLSARDHETLREILIAAARAEVMPRFRKLGSDAIRAKTSAIDLVTDADEAAERRIAADLARAFPGCVVVGEEGTAADPGLPARLADADLAFVVDPVDGTMNFASGLPLFAVMAAAIVKGEIAACVIHDPVSDETAMALRGEGAWRIGADGRATDMKVAAPAPLRQMIGMVAWRHLPEPLRSEVPGRYSRVADVASYRCCAHEYRLAASGDCHFLVFGRMLPWDHAPGTLMHREAGGYSALFDGSRYDPVRQPSGQICAPDRESWLALREALLGLPPLAGA
jgi:fructose-1,6-bisphosphatase/inositol monophosphatase family enzyme